MIGHPFSRIGLRRLGLHVVLILWLTACGTAENPIFPTPRPTFTPSLEPSVTPTPIFSATDTPTPVPIVMIPTSALSPTDLLIDLPTSAPITITPTLFSYAPGSLQIEYFTTNSTSVKAGDKLTLFWSAQGVEKAIIYRLDAQGKRLQVWNVARAGSMDVLTHTDDLDSVQFLLSIGDTATHLDQTLSVPIQSGTGSLSPCDQLNPLEGPSTLQATCNAVAGMTGTPSSSALAVEHFEHGQMIWLQQPPRIFVLFNDGQQPAWASYPDEFKDGQPDRDPSLRPPPGLLQPIRGFGLVWRTQQDVRQRIGWANGAEVPAEGSYQGDSAFANGTITILGQDGNTFALYNKGASWKLVSP